MESTVPCMQTGDAGLKLFGGGGNSPASVHSVDFDGEDSVENSSFYVCVLECSTLKATCKMKTFSHLRACQNKYVLLFFSGF